MKIDIEKISYEYLCEQVELVQMEIDLKANEIFEVFSLDDFRNMGDEEIVSIFEKFEFEDARLYSEKIKNYCRPGRFGFVASDFSDLFSINSGNEKQFIDNIINELNKKVSELNKKTSEELEILKYRLVFFEELIKYLYGSISIEKEDYFKISALILNSDLLDEDKFELSLFVSKAIMEKNKKLLVDEKEDKISVLEKKIEDAMNDFSANSSLVSLDDESDYELESLEVDDILESQGISFLEYSQYLEFARNIFSNYQHILSDNGFDKFDDLDTLFEIEELESIIAEEGLTLDNFVIFMISLISNIVKKGDSIKESFLKLKQLDSVYMNYMLNKEDLLNKLSSLESNLKLVMDRANHDFEFAKITNFLELNSNIQNTINSLLNEIDGYILEEKRISEINLAIYGLNASILEISKYEVNETEVVSLKSFILFDGFKIDTEECLPYILYDLSENNSKCLIDKEILNGRTSLENDYRVQMAKLITDLLLLGNPESLENKVGSVQDKKKNTTEPICYLTKNGDVDWKSPSGMYRIRPTTNSVARFAEQKIVLHKNTKIFRQVISLIKKYLPNTQISEDEDFMLYVNLGAAAKYSDEDLYGEVMKRYGVSRYGIISKYDVSSVLSLFYKNGEYKKMSNKGIELKDELSDSDCLILEQIISNSLEVYDELRELNSIYDFSIIDRMRGVKQYGLQ